MCENVGLYKTYITLNFLNKKRGKRISFQTKEPLSLPLSSYEWAGACRRKYVIKK